MSDRPSSDPPIRAGEIEPDAVADPLTIDGSELLALLKTGAFTLDGSGNLDLAAAGVKAGMIDFGGDLSNNNGTLSVTTEPNVPGWTKDGTLTGGSASQTFSLSQTYDRIKLAFREPSGSPGGLAVQLRVNGDSGANYDETYQDGTTTTGKSQVDLPDDDQLPGTEHHLQGRYPAQQTAWMEDHGGGNGLVEFVYQGAADISSITILNPNNNALTFEMEVFGR